MNTMDVYVKVIEPMLAYRGAKKLKLRDYKRDVNTLIAFIMGMTYAQELNATNLKQLSKQIAKLTKEPKLPNKTIEEVE